MARVVKLIMTSTSNNNKYYTMTDNENDTFTAEYGRVGSNPQTKTYPMHKWDSTIKAKTKKGYEDLTELFIVESNTDGTTTKRKAVFKDFLPSRTPLVVEIVKKLQGWAKGSIAENYNVTSEEVSQKQIDYAQNILNELVAYDLTKDNIDEFNQLLLKFFAVVPRKMKQVRDHLVNSDSDLQEQKNNIITSEQDTLDVMAGQVSLNTASSQDIDDTSEQELETDIIKSSGLDLKEVTEQSVIDTIKKLMADNSHKFKQAYEVVNNTTQEKYNSNFKLAKNKKEELFWHGSRNENWWSIITTGLLIRPSNAVHSGSMFGDGIYFADKFQKSFGYTSGRGSYFANGSQPEAILALYSVHVGEQKHIKRHDSSCYKLSNSILSKDGYDSVFAEGGIDLRNNEYIVYKSEQSTIKYLVIVNA